MSKVEEDYIAILSDLCHGAPNKEGRNGLTKHRWGKMLRHDMREGFPLLTTKRVWFNGAKTELLWILQGRTDLAYLHKYNLHYWDLNYDQSGRTDGTLGPVYGKQLRDLNGVDQLKEVILSLKHNPTSRRHLISLWQPSEFAEAALPPCWYSVQFNIEGDYIDIMWNQRSADFFLGVPFDLAMMALFLQLMAECVGKTARYVVGSFADVHLYHEHIEPAKEQLSRDIRELPKVITKGFGLDVVEGAANFVRIPNWKDIICKGYDPHPAIKAELL